MTHPLPLNALRMFVRCAHRLSIKAAAAELNLTPGAVSRQIQTLETHLGLPLFDRRHREIALTQMGAFYLAQVEPALAAIEGASQRVRELTGHAVVRVEATPTFALYWLIPRLPDFQRQHPDIEVRLSTATGGIDRGREVDLFIRRDPAHFAGLAGEVFMSEQAGLIAAPQLAASLPAAAADAIATGAAPLIRMHSRPDLWPAWFARQGRSIADAPHWVAFDNTILAIQAAIEGLGIALIPEIFVSGLLRAGALHDPLPTSRFASGDYHLLANTDSGGATAFRTWLRQQAAGNGTDSALHA